MVGWLVEVGRLPYALMPISPLWLVGFFMPKLYPYCQEIKKYLVCHLFSYGNNHSRINHIIYLISNGLSTAENNYEHYQRLSLYMHNIRISPYGKNISIYLYVARHLHPIPFKIFAGRLKDNFTWERKNISLETKRNLYFGAPFYLVIKASLLRDKFIFTWGHKEIITERSKYYLTRKHKKFIAWRQEKISTRRSNTSVLINQKHRTNTYIWGSKYILATNVTPIEILKACWILTWQCTPISLKKENDAPNTRGISLVRYTGSLSDNLHMIMVQ
ncbi:hypothetical protein BDB01DRAFT_838332 [Pilobolus umbonatus]|nr:hypothetical protein BDB01DRAFT_838332 [Pilobolus umbonatus]